MIRHWTDRLSEYLDGELSPDERVAVERHLANCAECRDTLEQLRAVVATARSLADEPPAADLWPAIATRIAPHEQAVVVDIGRRAERRRISFTVPQLLAASIAVAALSGSGVFLATRGGLTQSGEPVATQPANVRQVDTRTAETYYDAAIRQLETVLEQNRGRLDPATVSVIEENIRIIDRAIFDARTALERDPSNQFLNQHLENTMKRKIELLKRATSMS